MVTGVRGGVSWLVEREEGYAVVTGERGVSSVE